MPLDGRRGGGSGGGWEEGIVVCKAGGYTEMGVTKVFEEVGDNVGIGGEGGGGGTFASTV